MSLRDHAGAGVAALAAAAILCGCGASAGTSSSSASGSEPTTTASSTSTGTSSSTDAQQTGTVPAGGGGRPVAVPPPIGVTQHVSSRGAHLDVTVTRLIDPLRSSGTALLSGTRAVAVLVRIANNGPAVYDSSATGDFSVVSSAGVVTPVFVPTGICQTPLRDFDNYIAGGDVRTGCVAFAVGSHARVVAVRFSPHAAVAGRLSWRVGR